MCKLHKKLKIKKLKIINKEFHILQWKNNYNLNNIKKKINSFSIIICSYNLNLNFILIKLILLLKKLIKIN